VYSYIEYKDQDSANDKKKKKQKQKMDYDPTPAIVQVDYRPVADRRPDGLENYTPSTFVFPKLVGEE